MSSMQPESPVGLTPRELPTPPELALVTGSLDLVWEPVKPGDDDYMRWFGAWRLQNQWDFNLHHWYWSQHLSLWRRRAGRQSSTGLAASYAARWLREGFSQRQIASVLGYARTADAPTALWRLAADYQDYLQRAPFLRVDGPESVAMLEQAYVEGVKIARGEQRPEEGGTMYAQTNAVDVHAEDAVDQVRRHVRQKWRSPRVATLAEWEQESFAMPEPFSEGLLYSDDDRQRIERAGEVLRQQSPYHAAHRVAA